MTISVSCDPQIQVLKTTEKNEYEVKVDSKLTFKLSPDEDFHKVGQILHPSNYPSPYPPKITTNCYITPTKPGPYPLNHIPSTDDNSTILMTSYIRTDWTKLSNTHYEHHVSWSKMVPKKKLNEDKFGKDEFYILINVECAGLGFDAVERGCVKYIKLKNWK